jgi:general secretion pathway protein I
MSRSRAPGFTLVEVLVALVLVALGMAALLTALNSAATSTGYLRDKAFAHWVATNRLIETRLATNPPQNGSTDGVVEFGNQKWRWLQVVAQTEVPGMRRVDVSVRPLDPAQPDAPVTADSDWTLTMSGAVGARIALSNGAEPDWEPPPVGPPGGGGGPQPAPPDGSGGPTPPAPRPAT